MAASDELRGTSEPARRWYCDWRVWLSLMILVLLGVAGRIVGLPFRVLDSIWNLLF